MPFQIGRKANASWHSGGAEVLDRNYGNNFWSVNNSVNNLQQAKQAFDQWATDLKNRLQSGST